MKAILVRGFGGPEVLRVEDCADFRPELGTALNKVLVAVKAVGVNPVDAYIRAGIYPRKPELPYIPGTDAAGVVEAVTEDVKTFKPGDRVYVYAAAHAYAESIFVDASRVFPLPSALSFDQGAALGVPYGTAHRGGSRSARRDAGAL